MPEEELERYPVAEPADVIVARRGAAEIARRLGFPEADCPELALVVSELGANLVKYAQGGEISVHAVRAGQQVGLRVESADAGPGIPDVDLAVRDGYSTGGSLGTGLGAVNRLMDDFSISRGTGGVGARIVTTRWLRQHGPAPGPCPLAVGVASVPKAGEVDNGDTFLIRHWSSLLLVGVIDGLGHGAPAKRAAGAVRQYVQAHYDQPLTSIFRGAGVAARATRGAVMALARIDWEQERLEFASVGNIEVRAIGYPGRFNVMVRRGIVGLNAPDPKVSELPWPTSCLLILHSDGISSHWRWEGVAHLAGQPAHLLAHDLLAELGRDQDDSTILVVKAGAS